MALGGGDFSLDEPGQCGVLSPATEELNLRGRGSLLDGSMTDMDFGAIVEDKARWKEAAEGLETPLLVLLAGRLGLVL